MTEPQTVKQIRARAEVEVLAWQWPIGVDGPEQHRLAKELRGHGIQVDLYDGNVVQHDGLVESGANWGWTQGSVSAQTQMPVFPGMVIVKWQDGWIDVLPYDVFMQRFPMASWL